VKSAQSERDHDKALGVLATIAILYPNQAEARSLEAISLRARKPKRTVCAIVPPPIPRRPWPAGRRSSESALPP